MTIKLELTREMAELAMHALRLAATAAQERIDRGEADQGFEQVGQVQWLADYIEHKVKDAPLCTARSRGAPCVGEAGHDGGHVFDAGEDYDDPDPGPPYDAATATGMYDYD